MKLRLPHILTGLGLFLSLTVYGVNHVDFPEKNVMADALGIPEGFEGERKKSENLQPLMIRHSNMVHIIKSHRATLPSLRGNHPFHSLFNFDDKKPTSLSQPQIDSIPTRILRVPAEFPSIGNAVKEAKEGDWIIISPGKYFENKIEINKSITISSEWKVTGDLSKIKETIIDSEDESLFNILADGVEISGLNIINGDHTLNIMSEVIVMNNHFVNNLDAMSFEGPGGGYVGYNTVENDRDDGLDIDIGSDPDNIGSDILVEHNRIINSKDDGIEIRLFSYPDQNINYTIRDNSIIGSKNAGIQLISYDKYTGKEFMIHHNIIRGCKTGLGCMEGSKTVEDLSGASKMDELVYFFNNTLVDNQMGATGGNNIIAVNNQVLGNALGGFKRFGRNSAIVHNLFFRNGGDDFIELNNNLTKEGNIFSVDPLLDRISFMPDENSPSIDAGIDKYELKDIGFLEIPGTYIAGLAPDIGAIEYNTDNKIISHQPNLFVDAGKDEVLLSPLNEGALHGEINNGSEKSFDFYWKLENGPGEVDILDSNKIQTKVRFYQYGIYQFSLVVSEAAKIATDNKIIRYARDGEGKKLFLNDENTNIIEAEDYSYSYGNVSVLNDAESTANKFVKTEEGDSGQQTFIEYSVGTSENVDIFIWLLVKNQNSGKSTVQVVFNNQKSKSFSVSNNKKWKWIKVPVRIITTAGQWPVIVKNEEGAILIDKMLFSFDENYRPK
ncbi:right-handed parallel beta-helix repeat-containing protein [Cyclobacterium qasimii]|uniref:Right handed beta helix domain-containing protein n=2 Tax=Cyclobacterium qasimii TaxID=1350429 RepID=S7VFJ3_9BACT|nr:right-handed parallel beta-helix repeat-containing protein [Cyclobacterium qasimii]EPR69000.1 hypothetical protein ADICYQ_2000 [Cyclobacterium qasimii M12-11B]GEO24107.1 hypothetical protein CQA01_46410 [Cyclobacterium qasimii]